MKKFLAILLSVLMVLGMCSVAFATDGGTAGTEPAEQSTTTSGDETETTVTEATDKFAGNFKITMTGAEDGHTFSAYRIFDGSVSEDGILGDISWATGVVTANIITDLTTAGVTGLTETSTAADVAKALSTQKDDSDVMKKVADVFYNHKPAAAATVQTKTGDNYELTGLTAGYYLVTDDYTSTPADGAATLSRNVLAVVGDVTAKVKNDKPSVEKKILDPTPKDANQAGIGDHVFYQITGKVPNYEGYVNYFYVINDKLSNGLTFDGTNNLVVKVGETTLVKDTDYVVYEGEDGYTFQVAFKHIKNYDIGTAITVNYSATINENAVIGNTGNPNTTDLTYSNKPNESNGGNPEEEPKPGEDIPTGKSVEDKTVTYVAELDLTKYFDEVKAGNELEGAEFTLTGTSTTVVGTGTDAFVADADGDYYKLKDGTYTTTAPHANILRSDGSVAVESNEKYYDSTETKYSLSHVTEYTTIQKEVVMTGTSGANGKITFKGLGAGTYTLKETVTPAGYTTAEDITFTIVITPPTTITDGTETATFSVTGSEDVVLKDGSATAGIYETDVVDLKGAVLPSTGGVGTTIFYVLGSMLALAAVVLLIAKRRVNVTTK